MDLAELRGHRQSGSPVVRTGAVRHQHDRFAIPDTVDGTAVTGHIPEGIVDKRLSSHGNRPRLAVLHDP